MGGYRTRSNNSVARMGFSFWMAFSITSRKRLTPSGVALAGALDVLRSNQLRVLDFLHAFIRDAPRALTQINGCSFLALSAKPKPIHIEATLPVLLQ